MEEIMRTNLIFLTCSLLLGISLFCNKMNAQNIDAHGNNKFFAGVRMPYTSQKSNETTLSPTLLDTLYSLPTPGTWPSGLAWDGQYFWNCDHDSLMIYKLTTTGDVVSSFPIPDSAVSGGGLEWDGNYLWLADEGAAILFKIDTTTGLAIEHFHLPSFGQSDPNGFGLAWDGQYLWHSEYSDSAMIYKLNPQNGQVVSSFVPPKSLILGITWADGFLYGVSIEFALSGGILYKFEPSSGVVLDSAFWEVPYPLGLVWDGQYFQNVSSKIFYGGNQRIYQVSNPITSIDNNSINKPSSIVLMQNYPNPFNPTTTISYRLLTTSDVDLSIFNNLGQKVKTLVKTKQSAGIYQFKWNGTSDESLEVSCGIYLYRLRANSFIKTRKMILLK
jgi:hypothetical protein